MEMSNPHGIIILGANGSGKSILGRELAHVLNFAHFNAEDYYWHKTDMPFTVTRSHKERNEMLLSDIEKHGSFIMSGDVSNWGEQFLPLFDLVVFLTVPSVFMCVFSVLYIDINCAICYHVAITKRIGCESQITEVYHDIYET